MSFSIVIPDFSVPRISNETLLIISMCLFFVFVIAEIAGAVMSNSLSLLGDAVCMSVDILTYMGNFYVEWYKKKFQSQSSFVIEILIPTLSVLTLFCVTIYIAVDAVKLLIKPPLVNDVNVAYLYWFATANLLVDVSCGALYYLKGEEIFLEIHDIPKISLDISVSFDLDDEFGSLDEDCLEMNPVLTTPAHSKHTHSVIGFFSTYCCVSGSVDSGEKRNLNMMAAFTHVLGDTLRTVAVFVAALVSTLTGIDADICDAWAAVAVTVTIMALCCYLMLEIRKVAVDLYCDEQHGDGLDRRSKYFFIPQGMPRSSSASQQRGRYAPVQSDDDDLRL